jgi:hypothetical protein
MKLTTVALNDNQHLEPVYFSSVVEVFCKGYENGKRFKALDGHYFSTELKGIKPKF